MLHSLKEIEEAFTTLASFARSQIIARRAQTDDGLGRTDMCNSIVKANEDDAKVKLNDEEIMGDIFAVLLAGHGA